MNLHYPVPERTNRSMLWILIAALLLTSLIAAMRTSVQNGSLNITPHPAAISANQPVPVAVPVPEPADTQPLPYPGVSATPVPQGAQFSPVPQRVPTPPSGP
jgi:hypothetical protein